MTTYDALPLRSYSSWGIPKNGIPGLHVGVKYDLAISELLKKKKLNVVHVSRIEFGLLVNSNFFYISSNIKVKEKLKQETIIEVKNIEEADLILIDEDVWLSEN